jgi:SAM-dependent MidA family methyltransferase
MIPKPESGLPQPDADSVAQSRRVTRHLQTLIGASPDGIPFSQFMHEALYAPGLGYYSAGARKFGAAGDFVTAPEASPLFGAVLARQLSAPVRETAGSVLEIGAGTGALAVQLLGTLRALDALPAEYLILEASADLEARQRDLIAAELPTLLSRVRWVAEPPGTFRGVVLANEVADAIAVERFVIGHGGRVEQARVVNAGSGFGWHHSPAPDFLETAVRRIEADLGRRLPVGYRSEVSPALHGWVEELAAGLEHGLMLLIDYGVSRREYYAPDRGGGWLRCHFRHRVHDDPLRLPGIQDISAWVDFTAVAEAATGAGLQVAGYAPQGLFLLHGGLDRELSSLPDLSPRRQAEMSGQAKLLTMPAEMGENFKFIALTRGDVEPLAAFRGIDRAHVL